MAKAIAFLGGAIRGTVTFEQATNSSPITIAWKIDGLDPSAQRGFHIHELGDLTNGCISAGPHFNPFGRKHGGPLAIERHVGDLGNISSNPQGTSEGSIIDNQVTLFGVNSVLGVGSPELAAMLSEEHADKKHPQRTIVVHAGTDDLRTDPHGNAGPRLACGVIGIWKR